jgi:hypothetical protein
MTSAENEAMEYLMTMRELCDMNNKLLENNRMMCQKLTNCERMMNLELAEKESKMSKKIQMLHKKLTENKAEKKNLELTNLELHSKLVPTLFKKVNYE